MIAGMAWRVKYRKLDSDGNVLRMKLPLPTLGVHPKNRGGVYAAGLRCKNLNTEVIESGFVKEEVDHQGVAVEETPFEHVKQRGSDYETGKAYNKNQSSKDELLETCFREPYDDVRHMLLAHNTIMLVLRAWLTQAKWDIPFDEKRQITYCDDMGRLSVTAVAAHKNGKELEVALRDGFLAEILSWKMDLEEPTAASTISQALNKGHELALRTTELTAVAVLKGEILLQSKNVSQKVLFQSVRDQVRRELGGAADDPDLIEVFEFLISLGVGKNSYVDHLEEFTKLFVNSKFRQLRFLAFANANLIPDECPLIKVALIKRAYRKKPNNGFCPSPEADWGKYPKTELKDLEDLLRFFHRNCSDVFANMTTQSRGKMLGNIDVTCTDAFYAAKQAKKNAQKIRESLLEVTVAHAKELNVAERAVPKCPWIDFSKANKSETEKEKANEDSLKMAPRIILFDEKTGSQLTAQDEIAQKDKAQNVPVKLPWKQWLKKSQSCGALEGDKASAVAALEVLHDSFNEAEANVEIWNLDGKIFATTPAVAEQHSIWLPPCIPKQSKVFEASEHPCAIKILQKVMKTTGEKQEELSKEESSPDAGSVCRENTFYVLPEFKFPAQEKSAVAETTADEALTWNWEGAETMHPFWAVRRLNEKQLQTEVQAWKPETGKPRHRFNCELRMKPLSAVVLGIINERSLNRTRLLKVPFLINHVELVKNEELILEVLPMKKKETIKKRTWRDEVKDDERKMTQAKSKQKTSAMKT
jgi:hypothetical protein